MNDTAAISLPAQRRRRRSFTLIELLVVVAIISILASIAVPNFLEAMTRAKVARAKNDLRVLAMALETFAIDHNDYPKPKSYDDPPFQDRLRGLVTPISYLTSLPDDIFPEENRQEPALPRVHKYDYFPRDVEIKMGRAETDWQRAFGNSEWKIDSAGPDGSFFPPYGDFGFGARYDPTNGTRSAGDIVRIR